MKYQLDIICSQRLGYEIKFGAFLLVTFLCRNKKLYHYQTIKSTPYTSKNIRKNYTKKN